jgi:hypothetical protein
MQPQQAIYSEDLALQQMEAELKADQSERDREALAQSKKSADAPLPGESK